ncbi:MAG: hypothetical protein LBS43_06355 [Prevotellaceae bacterium]|jgi:hypothetical protein|nr:hypothetical protein [Prevotellaceae bacterium]
MYKKIDKTTGAKIPHARGKNSSRIRQKLHTCPAKFSYVRGKISARARQNFLTCAAAGLFWLVPVGFGWVRLGSAGFGWVWLGSAGFGWVRLGSAGRCQVQSISVESGRPKSTEIARNRKQQQQQ